MHNDDQCNWEFTKKMGCSVELDLYINTTEQKGGKDPTLGCVPDAARIVLLLLLLLRNLHSNSNFKHTCTQILIR